MTISLVTIVSKGISGHLMKASAKRRRSKQQIKEDKEREQWQKDDIQRKLAHLEQMEKEFRDMQHKVQKTE